jgi:putative chitinase
MTLLTPARLALAAPELPQAARPAWVAELSAAATLALIDTAEQWAHWLGQMAHESSGFTRMEENLNYSAERVRAVWSRRFPTDASAQVVARNPRLLANTVYNGRMSNRPGSDDGWHFRGRGPKQITGRDNYTSFNSWCRERDLLAPGQDVRTSPELLLQPRFGSLAAAWYWSANNLGAILDRLDGEAACRAMTRRINGGQIGFADRWRRTRALLVAFGGPL